MAINPNKDDNRLPDSVQNLITLTHHDMGCVNDLILSKVDSQIPLISSITHHLISSGGKRLRPMLTLASAKMFGYEGEAHIKLAASVEFMHTATLLHDDVVDESNLRRGHNTARRIWGNQASVLVGDYLLGQAFRIMVDAGCMDSLRILSDAASIIAQGEVMQLASASNLETTEDQHLAVIQAKTATLFSAAAEVGPVIAGAPENTRQAMRSYGMNLGLAFQLIDDVLDYNGLSEHLGKNTGDDFREGKVTLPVILSYHRSTKDEKKFWKHAIEKHYADDSAFQHAMHLMIHHNALNDTIARAKYFAHKAQRSLHDLPPSPQKDALFHVISFCIERIT